MKKFFISVLLTLGLVLNLTGCGDVGKESQTPSLSDVAETQTDVTESALKDTENHSFWIRFLDVGQADAALVACDGHYMLIDGGNKADSDILYTVLKNAGITHLDMVVGTHAHEDHIGGIPGALNYADADLVLCATTDYESDSFGQFKKYAGQKGGGILVPSVGDTYALGSATVRILGVNSEHDTNNTSIVLRITYQETDFLFTGDAEREAEQVLLQSGADLSATVLKVGHHGSETSTTYPFLREVMPQYAVISVGAGNTYGHPSENTLSRLRDAGVSVYRTDLQGDIVCTSDGKTVHFSAAKTKADDRDVAVTVEQESTVESAESEPMVWIPYSGSKYHSNSQCSNMKNPTQVTQDYAEAEGYTACKKCW